MKTMLSLSVLLTAALVFSSPAQSAEVRRSTSTAAAEAFSPGTLRFSGMVVDAAGQPVAGALVEFYQNDRGFSFGREGTKPPQTVTTDTKGTFAFQGSCWFTTLFAHKPGLAPDWVSYWNPMEEVTDERLVLSPPTTLAGMVVDDADKPVADARVWLTTAYGERPVEDGRTVMRHLSSSTPWPDAFSVRTGPDGKFRIEGCPSNAAVDLAVSKPGKCLRELPREHISPDTMRCRTGEQAVKLVLDPAGTIQGKVVVQDTDRPVAGARLSLQPAQPGSSARRSEAVLSGPDGSFRFTEAAPGSYRISAVFGTNAVPEWVADSVPVSVEAGQTTPDILVPATRGGWLEVTVLGKENRKPLAQATVESFKEASRSFAQASTNSMARLRLPPGKHYLYASRETSRSKGTAATVELGKTNRVEIELSPPAKLAGTVRDASGAPVPGLLLRTCPEYAASSARVKTDANGHYEMVWNAQRPGMDRAVLLVGRDVARNLATAQEIEEGTTNLNLKLEPGLVVTGGAEDETGKPLTNATVQLHLWVGNMGSQFDNKPIQTDAQGRFKIAALPSGRKYSLWVQAKGYGRGNATVDADTEINRVELPTSVLKLANRKIAGQVFDADDRPVPGANVNIQGDSQPFANVRTDNQGSFTLEACEGQARLFASYQSSYGNVSAQGGDTNVVLKLGVSQASRQVSQGTRRASLRGKPLPDLAGVKLDSGACPAGKPVLLCLFDLEQRPSRALIRSLVQQHDALKQKGLTILGLQASVTTAEALKEWKDANPMPFPVGYLAEKSDKTKWVAEVETLPWLILTDAEHRVRAEGFALDEVDAKLKTPGKNPADAGRNR